MFMDSDWDYCTKPGHFWLESSRFTSRGTCLVTSCWRTGLGKTDAYLNSYGLFVDTVKSTARGLLCSGTLVRASGVPWVSKSTHPRKFGNHVTVHRTNDRPSAPQAYQCLLSHFLASLGAQEKTDCTSML